MPMVAPSAQIYRPVSSGVSGSKLSMTIDARAGMQRF